MIGSTPATAQADDLNAANRVILTDDQEKYPLGLHMDVLEDPGGELTIDDVPSPVVAGRFMASSDEMPIVGLSESDFWIRLPLRNQSHLNDRWLLEVGFANMHFDDQYSPLLDDDGFATKQTRNTGCQPPTHPSQPDNPGPKPPIRLPEVPLRRPDDTASHPLGTD